MIGDIFMSDPNDKQDDFDMASQELYLRLLTYAGVGEEKKADPHSRKRELLGLMGELSSIASIFGSKADAGDLTGLLSRIGRFEGGACSYVTASNENSFKRCNSLIRLQLKEVVLYSNQYNTYSILFDHHDYSHPDFANNLLGYTVSDFSRKFIGLLEEWYKSKDISLFERLRKGFIETVERVGHIQKEDIARIRTDFEASKDEYARSIGRMSRKLPDLRLPLIPELSKSDFPGLDGEDETSSGISGIVDNNLSPFTLSEWEQELVNRGMTKGSFNDFDALPDDLKTFFFVYQYHHLISALVSLRYGCIEKAAKRVENITDYELDGTGDCFVATVLDTLSLVEPSVKDMASDRWKKVVSKVFSSGSELSLEAITRATSRRSVSTIAANKIKEGSMIIRSYPVDNPESCCAARRDIAISRFASDVLGNNGVVPQELACFEREGILYHVEKRMHGITFEEYHKRKSFVAANKIPRIVYFIDVFHRILTEYMGTKKEGDELRGFIGVSDPSAEFEEKFMGRMPQFCDCLGFTMDVESVKQAMSVVTGCLGSAPGGIVHNDLRGANIIISNSPVVTIIDLEKMSEGKFICDIANFIEHSAAESRLIIDAPLDLISSFDWCVSNHIGRDELERLFLCASIFKISHLCGSVVKYHFKSGVVSEIGADRVCSYANNGFKRAAGLASVCRGELRDSADEIGSFFSKLGAEVYSRAR